MENGTNISMDISADINFIKNPLKKSVAIAAIGADCLTPVRILKI